MWRGLVCALAFLRRLFPRVRGKVRGARRPDWSALGTSLAPRLGQPRRERLALGPFRHDAGDRETVAAGWQALTHDHDDLAALPLQRIEARRPAARGHDLAGRSDGPLDRHFLAGEAGRGGDDV